MPNISLTQLIKPVLSITLMMTVPMYTALASSEQNFINNYSAHTNISYEHIPLLYSAEENATSQGSAVLRQARIMALDKGVSGRGIGGGGCWDYLNKMFTDAGFPLTKRPNIFKGNENNDFLQDHNKIQTGDWLYFINHSYGGSGHSGMFIDWVNKSQNTALIFSYAGENRDVPGKYTIYDLSDVYEVIRPVGDGNGNAIFNQNSVSSSHMSHGSNLTQVNQSSNPINTQNNTINHQSNTAINHHNNNYDNSSQRVNSGETNFINKYASSENIYDHQNQLPVIYKAHQESSSASKKVIDLSKEWTLDSPKIVQGTSANYVNQLFHSAGVRQNIIFKGDLNGSFYKNSSFQSRDLVAGDWVSFINFSYKNSPHDGIFIGWENNVNNRAVILSYGGENRSKPARYRTYDISNIYTVIRPTY